MFARNNTFPKPSSTDFTSLVNAFDTPFSHPASRFFLDKNCMSTRADLKSSDNDLVRTALVSVDNILSTIQAGLQDVEAVTSFLSAQKAYFEHQRAQYQALLAPIRRLPTELLQEVFTLVCANETENMHIPSVVAQVSRYWRQVALSTPGLWTTIVARLLPKGLAGCMDHISLWLQRAAGCTVSLCIYSDVPERGAFPRWAFTDSQETTTFAKMIAANAHRIHLLVLKSDILNVALMCNVWKESKVEFPVLRVLEASKRFFDESGEENWSHMLAHLASSTSPVLETLILLDGETGDLEPANIHWNTLKHLRGSIKPNFFTSLASTSCPPIELLDVVVYDEEEMLTLPPSINQPLQRLTALALTRYGLPSTVNFLPPLPSLRYLSLKEMAYHNPSSFIPLLQAWGSQLLYLSLTSYCPQDETITGLRLTPNLEALRLPWTTVMEQVEILDPEILPALTHLELDALEGYLDGDMEYPRSLCEPFKACPLPYLRHVTVLLDNGSRYIDEIRPVLVEIRNQLSECNLGAVFEETQQDQYLSISFTTPYMRERLDLRYLKQEPYMGMQKRLHID